LAPVAFQDIVETVRKRTESSIKRLGQDGIKLLNLVVPKPQIPPDIAANYKQVKKIFSFSILLYLSDKILVPSTGRPHIKLKSISINDLVQKGKSSFSILFR